MPDDTAPKGSPPIAVGLFAGSIAGMVGIILNLPLESPSDAFLNSASVGVVSLAAGLGAGVLWRGLGRYPRHRMTIFIVSFGLIFALIILVAALGEAYIERSLTYIIPVSAAVLGVTCVLTIALMRLKSALPWWLASLTAAMALGVGLALAGQGDQEDGRLELPPRTSAVALRFHDGGRTVWELIDNEQN